MPRRRIAVVSPFIDKRHGTERRVAECVSRLADDYEFHIYSNRVEDLDLSRVIWHRIPALPGPHLFAYLWWFAANHLWRWRDRQFKGLVPDLVYSPGINCLDAGAVSVHIVFACFLDLVKDELSLRRNPIASWPQLIHRQLYYRLIVALERMVYPQPGLPLAIISRKVASDLREYHGRTGGMVVVYNGLEFERFSPERRIRLRDEARSALGFGGGDFVFLLIGNDWKKKGLACLLEALSGVSNAHVRLLIAGRDNPAPFASLLARAELQGRVHFAPPRPDVEFYYAAADAYVGPSLEDAFAQPPAEAMACGLPAITTRLAGVSEIMNHGVDGLILERPTDAATLAGWIKRLSTDPEWCKQLGEAAARTARLYTWERNAEQMRDLFERSFRPSAAP